MIACVVVIAKAENKAAEPVPVAIAKFNGEELPVYEFGKLPSPSRSLYVRYPDDVGFRGIPGKAAILAVVDEEGHVVSTKIIESSPRPEFGRQANKAVMYYRFRKVTRGGKPTRFVVVVPVLFVVD